MRWIVSWLLLIALVTAGAYWRTNAMVGEERLDHSSLAMQPIGELGSAECSRATRELVAAGDGAADDATAEQRAGWNRAASAVLAACGNA